MRMKYPQYHRDGLPVTSSHMESYVKELNYRVQIDGEVLERRCKRRIDSINPQRELVVLLAQGKFDDDGRPPRQTTFATIEDFGHLAGRNVAQALGEVLEKAITASAHAALRSCCARPARSTSRAGS